MKRCLLSFAALCAVSFSTAQAAQPLTAPVLASDIADRYANLIYYGSGATGMAMVVIDGNQRVFRSFGETRPGNNVHPQLDSVIRIASLTKLMTSEMLVKLLDQGVVKLDDPLSKYVPPGARVPTYQGTPIRLVNLATHTSALPREQPGGAAHRDVFVWPTRDQRWSYLSTATLKAARGTLKPGWRLVAAFQPHLFSRTRDLYEAFAESLAIADEIFLCDIYPAREVPIPGVTTQLIVDALKARGVENVTYPGPRDALLEPVMASLRPGDLFITLGAGSIDRLGVEVLARLQGTAR